MTNPSTDQSLPALLQRIAREGLSLLSAEVTLAKIEAGNRARLILLGFLPLTAMLVLLGVGFVTLTVGAILGLGGIIGYGWAAFLIGLVEITLAAAAGLAARSRFLAAVAVPDDAAALAPGGSNAQIGPGGTA